MLRYSTISAILLGSIAMAFVQCSSEPAENLATTAEAVVASVTEHGLSWSVEHTASVDLLPGETTAGEAVVAAIGPQSSPAACNFGAAVFTYGASGVDALHNQHLSRATLPCLGPGATCSAPSRTDGASPAVPTQFGGDLLHTGFSNVKDAQHPWPLRHLSVTDAEVIRVGQTDFMHLASGQRRVYGGSPLAVINDPNTDAYWVDYYRHSHDCGATWDSDYSMFEWSDANIAHWNFDQPHLYVDPFNVAPSGKHYAYIVGSVATVARGIAESADGGQTWNERGYVGDVIGPPGGIGDDFGFWGYLTSTADGTQFFFTCVANTARLYWSYNRWSSYKSTDVSWDGDSTPCNWLAEQHGSAERPFGTHDNVQVGISRVAPSEESPQRARVRVLFPDVTGTGTSRRQVFRLATVAVGNKSNQTIGATVSQLHTVQGSDSSNSVIEAGFTEPDPFDTPRGPGNSLPDTSVLWWWEANHGSSDATTTNMSYYSVVQGARTVSTPRELGFTRRTFKSDGWTGHYNRSTYFYHTTQKRQKHLLLWPSGNRTSGNLSTRQTLGYNVVSIAPSISANTVNVEELDFGSLTSNPSVSSQGANQLDVFWVNSSGDLTQKRYNNSWVSGVTNHGKPAGATLVGDPASASWGSGRVDLFIRGSNGNIYQRWKDDSLGLPWTWSVFDNSAIASNLAVASLGSRKLHVFARALDGSINYRRYTEPGGWSGWISLGGVGNSDPVAVSNQQAMHVLVRGGNNNIYQKWTTDGINWFPSAWENLGLGSPGMTTAPAAAMWGPGRLDVFAGLGSGSSLTLMHAGYEAGWPGEWFDLATDRNGLGLAGNGDAASWAAGRVDVFGKSVNNKLWHAWFTRP